MEIRKIQISMDLNKKFDFHKEISIGNSTFSAYLNVKFNQMLARKLSVSLFRMVISLICCAEDWLLFMT